MDVPRDPLGRLLGGLSLLNDGQDVICRLNPNTGEGHRWSVAVDEERVSSGPTFLEAVMGAYRSTIDELEGAVQRQTAAALERSNR